MQIEGFNSNLSFPGGGASGKEPTWQCRRCRRHGFDLWVGKISWRREWPPTPVFWPGEFYELYSPWGHKESDTADQVSLHFSSSKLLKTAH